jgi:NADH-quinone oxidoreductase subunit L
MPDATLTAAALTTLLPFAAFVIIMVITRAAARLSATVSIAAVTVSLVSSVYLLVTHWHLKQPIQYVARWVVSGDVSIPYGYLLDPVSLLMLAVVTGICFLVQVYSLGYMADDPGFARYYAFMSLFVWAMTSLTLSPTLLQLYVFWELVGLSSYLLIGFWYEKFSASEAGKKAFVMTRLGDVAFFLGILLILLNFGNLNMLELNSRAPVTQLSSTLLTVSSLLIFGGIIGKSAQFPLLTWLPDAMEGPTPVSALLHSATMVAAGVYLFARLFPYFSHSPTAMTVFLAIGTISMLLSSTMAMVSRDIKRVWAYSTISQLGYMIMGLAAGSYFAGVFHLTTHAGFKALLFLCSGVFIHAFETNDMVEIGQYGGRRLKTPMICMAIAGAALAGLPPASGFFSKELVIGALAELSNPVWLAAGLIGVFLTAYYTFRLIFIILFPKNIKEPEAPSHHLSRSGYWVMCWPLIVLAFITLILGFGQRALEGFMGAVQGVHHAWLPVLSVGLVASAILLVWVEFGRRGAAQVGFVERMPRLNALFSERWYLDRFYRWMLDRVVYGIFSFVCTRNDQRVIDGGIHGLSRGLVQAGGFVSWLHTGMVQYKIMTIFIVLVLLALYFFV